MRERMGTGLPAATRRRRLGRSCRNAVIAFSLGAVVLAATPGLTLAAAYPVTGVSQLDYALVGPSADTQTKMAQAGCIVLALANELAGAACALGTLVWTPTQEQTGWWRDQIWQTSQAYVHIGQVCNKSKSSCTLWKWDIYVKTHTPLDTGCFAYLFRYGPSLYGASQVYACPRWPFESIGEVMNVINGNGL